MTKAKNGRNWLALGDRLNHKDPETQRPKDEGMRTIRTWQDQLESLHKRSGLYWPSTDHQFTNLLTFLVGFQCGYGVAKQGYDISPEQLVPLDFDGFVAQRFGYTQSDKGWRTLIREHTTAEQEAFDLFFQLREEYESTRSA